MIGVRTSEQRRMLEEGFDAIMHLLRSDEPLTVHTDWFTLVEAKCQLPLYDRDIEIAVAAIQSPSGPRLAGKHGVGLISIGATMQIGADVLALHHDVWEEIAAENGHTAFRRDWRLVGLMHCAETREQAMRDVEYGIDAFFEYLQSTSATPHFVPEGDTVRERIEWINESGIGAIGTPEDCVRQIESLWKQSGGFGSYLCMHHDYADPEATNRSYELMAQRVFPQFQNNAAQRLADATNRARVVRDRLMEDQAKALAAWTEKHHAERAEMKGRRA
jgi:alkanesulfonate monooxygenase SsuD/methylene tetrahydromethanopterin reductase-like flavin-dependent oxidoreductase (luciferase family)